MKNKFLNLCFLSIIFFFFIITYSFSQEENISYCFNKNLKYGKRNIDVIYLQKILNMDEETQVANQGAGSPGNEQTYFGISTKRALKKWQSLNDLPSTGIFDETTRKEMNDGFCSKNIISTTPSTINTPTTLTNTPTTLTNTPTTIINNNTYPRFIPDLSIFTKESVLINTGIDLSANESFATLNFNFTCKSSDYLYSVSDCKEKDSYHYFLTGDINMDLGKNPSQIVLHNLISNKFYNIKLYAKNEKGSSLFTSFIDLNFKSEDLQIHKNIAGFYLSNITSNSVQLNWNDFQKTKEETTLYLEYSSKNSEDKSSTGGYFDIKNQTCSSGVCKYIVNNLLPNRTYTFKIKTTILLKTTGNVWEESIFRESQSITGETLLK